MKSFRVQRTIAIIMLFLLLFSVYPSAIVLANQEHLSASDTLTQFDYTEVSLSTGKVSQTGFVYNDGFFFLNNQQLSPEIAKISIALSSAIYSKSIYEYPDLDNALSQMQGYTYKRYNAISGKGNWGRAHTVQDNDFVRYVIAKKENVNFQGEDYIIYCVIVQGTSGSFDWNSDFNIGNTANHEGFYLAHNDIMTDLYETMSNDGYSSDHRIVWTTGHSRGAAVSNIVAGELTSGYSNSVNLDFSGLVSANHIFSYNFACPSVSRSKSVTGTDYHNIYNFNNEGDVIPTLPLEDWGYGLYGQTIPLRDTDYINVAQRFKTETSEDFKSTTNTVVYLDAVIREWIPNAEQANTPIAQGVFRGLAYILNENQSISNFFESIGIFVSEHAWEVAQTFYDDPSEGINEYLSYVDHLSVLIPQYLDETADMEKEGYEGESFSEWFDRNRVELERMETIFNYNISERADLERIKMLVVADQLACGIDFGVSATNLTHLLTTMGDLWFYFNGTDGAGGAMTAVTHGHMSETYLLWINSMYFGYYGWYGNHEAVSGSIQDSVLTIAPYCFSDSVIRIVSPMDSVCYLAPYSFADAGLVKIELPDSITQIGDAAFSGCAYLTHCKLPSGMTEIVNTMFYGCESLSSIELLSSLITIGDYAFCGCGMEEVVIPDSVTNIGDSAFYDCENLKRLTIGEGVESIGNRAFSDCTDLEQLSINARNITQFAADDNKDNHVFANAGKNSVGISVIFGDAVETILDQMFYIYGYSWLYGYNWEEESVPQIKSVKIGDHVTSIGEKAFYGLTSLTSVTMPASVETIGYEAFEGCTGITEVYYASSKNSWDLIDFSSGNDILFSFVHYGEDSNPFEGKLGENGEISWSLNSERGIVLITGQVSSEEPVYVACYNANSQMLSLNVIITSGSSVEIKAECAVVKVFWLDSVYIPKCKNAEIKVKQ